MKLIYLSFIFLFSNFIFITPTILDYEVHDHISYKMYEVPQFLSNSHGSLYLSNVRPHEILNTLDRFNLIYFWFIYIVVEMIK